MIFGTSLRRTADDKSKVGKPDRDRINVGEDYELRDWSERFGVSAERLKAAVHKLGPMVDDVRRELGK
jgi:hypothetical protein